MTSTKQKKKTQKPKKEIKPIELTKTELKGLTTANFLSNKFKKAIKEKFGEVAFPIILTILEEEPAVLVFEQTNRESIEQKILTIRYSQDELSTKELIELKDFLKQFGDKK